MSKLLDLFSGAGGAAVGYHRAVLTGRETMKKHEAFFIGIGVGYILEKYDGDFWYGLKCVVAEYQRKAEVERRRVVDVFGDEVSSSISI